MYGAKSGLKVWRGVSEDGVIEVSLNVLSCAVLRRVVGTGSKG